MGMTKVDFEGMARALREAQAATAHYEVVDREVFARIYAEKIADHCGNVNRMFNREKFLTASILVEEPLEVPLVDEHKQPDFYAKYGFCPVDCKECDRLDAADLRPHSEKVADGLAKAVAALRAEGQL